MLRSRQPPRADRRLLLPLPAVAERSWAGRFDASASHSRWTLECLERFALTTAPPPAAGRQCGLQPAGHPATTSLQVATPVHISLVVHAGVHVVVARLRCRLGFHQAFHSCPAP